MRILFPRFALFSTLALVGITVVVCCLVQWQLGAVAEIRDRSIPSTTDLQGAFSNLPLHFESNRGQWGTEPGFLTQGPNYHMQLSGDGAVIALASGDKSKQKVSKVTMKVAGSNEGAQPVGEEISEGKVNYFIGSDQSKWNTDIPTYKKVRYDDVYSGIDLVYYGKQTELEFDFVVAPGADPKQIGLDFGGADRIAKDTNGNLRISIGEGDVILEKPILYQPTSAGREPVDGEFALVDRDSIRFKIGEYDPSRELVIDPVLSYSTFLPGGNWGTDIAVDAQGNAIVTGFGSGVPTTNGTTIGGVFVTKFNPQGSNLIFSTRVGGNSGSESGRALRLDPSGNIVVAGSTSGNAFPHLNALTGRSTVFVSTDSADTWANQNNLLEFQTWQIAPSLQDPNLLYAAAASRIYRSTNGGASWTNVTNNLPPASFYQLISVNPSNASQIMTVMSLGVYRSNDGGGSWAQVPGALVPGGGFSAIEYDPNNSQIIYISSGNVIRKTTDGGQTWTSLNGGLPTNIGLSALVIDPANSSVLYAGSNSQGVWKSVDAGANWTAVNSGFIGTNSNVIRKLAVDPTNPNNIYAGTGSGSSAHLLFKSVNGGASWSLAYTSPGPQNHEIGAIAVSRTNSSRVYLGLLGNGIMRSNDGGATWGRAQNGMRYNRVSSIVESPFVAGKLFAGTGIEQGVSDAFVFKLSASGNSFIYSTTLGGSEVEAGTALTVDSDGNAYVGGTTKSSNFPTVNAVQNRDAWINGSLPWEDGFVTKIAPNGGTISYSTYLGGGGIDSVASLAVDNQGKLAITGRTLSTDFPLVNSHQATLRMFDVFVTKLSPTGNALEFSTLWGSTGDDAGNAIGIDSSSNIVVTGNVSAPGMTTVNALQPTYNGSSEGFVTKFSPDGSQILFSTHFGGRDSDSIQDVDIDAAGNIYLAGNSSSRDFPQVRSIKSRSTYYRSSNKGDRWANLNNLVFDISDIAFHPTDVNVMLAISTDGLMRTTDGGDTWAKVLSAPASATAVEFDPQNGARIFLGYRENQGATTRLGLSTDGGATWNPATIPVTGSDPIFKIVVYASDPQIAYAVVSNGVFKTTNGGLNWSRTHAADLWPVGDFAMNPANPAILYVSRYFSNGGIHRSLDGGVTWEQMPLGVGQAEFVVIDPLQPSTVYARSTQGVFKTVNNGETWAPLQNVPPTGYRLTVDPFSSSTLYMPVHPTASFPNSGVYRTTNSGATWTLLNGGMPRSSDFSRIEADPRLQGTLHGNVQLDSGTTPDVFVSKMNPAGSSLLYSSVIGGDTSTSDFANAIAVTSDGSAFVTGGTNSPDFPVTPGAYHSTVNNTTLFVARFDASWSVKGKVTEQQTGNPLGGVSVSLNGGGTLSTDSDGLGKYLFPNVRENLAYTLTPRKLGYDFTPANYTIGSLGQDETLNFTAAYTAYQLQGTVTLNGNPLPNATVTLSGSTSGTATSDSSGNYSFMVPKYGDYSVRASLDGYIFTPQQHTFANVTTQLQANFAARAGYAIGGQILRNGNPIPGVSVALSGSENQTISTDTTGRYSFDAGLAGSYTVTPSAPGLGFTPISQSFANLSSNQTGNFTAYRFESTIDRITFVTRASFSESQTDIFTIDAEGTDLRRLTTTSSTSESQPAWSPNGRKIAYLKSPSGPLWMMDYDGGNDHPVITDIVQISSPDWSPDGRRIAFHGIDPMSGLPKIFVANNDGTGVQMITSGPSWDENPNWSPDGTKIIFNRLDKLYTVNPNGTGLQILLNSTLGQSEADWSPNGQEIVFRGANGSSGRIYIVGANGTNLRRLTSEDTEESSPAWSLDGTRIAYVRGGTNIYTRNTSGGDLKQITTGFETKSSPCWRPPLRLPPVFDFDGDAKTDVGIFRPSVGEWWYKRSMDGQVPAFQFGSATDKIVPADYTGDGKTDVAIWRPDSGDWFVLRSEDLSYFSFPFGTVGDIPVPADYDGDGRADAAVFRSSTTTWYVRRSSDNGVTILTFGASGDVPVVADYDGDAKADVAIYRPSNGQWWLNRTSSGVIAATFGTATDRPVPGEYTGDGKFDIAFWRPSTGEWFILRSEDSTYYSSPFGSDGDIPAPGDYDGDGKFDITVFRPSGAMWFAQRTAAGTLIQQFGSTGDTPLPSAFTP